MLIETNIKNRVVGVDISLDTTSIAIVDVRGNIIASDSLDTSDYPFVSEYMSALCERIVNLAERNGGYECIRSMGISSPSGNNLTGCIENAPNLKWKGVVPLAAMLPIENAPNLKWKGVVPLAAMLRDRLGLAVALDNDAHSSALGEHAFGCAHGMNNFILISLGHGIGSCIFSNGRVHQGANGFAGEIGHTCVVPKGRTCGCGKQGCLEAYCGAHGIVLTANEMMAESNKHSLMRNIDHLTPKDITACCEQGDEMAQEVFKRTGRMLGLALSAYASLLDPEAIILTGGLSKAGHWLTDPAQEEFEKHVFHNIRGRVKFLESALDDHERDMLGASALAWGIKEYSLFK